MNTDFRLSIGLFTHPKFLKLKRRLGETGALSYIVLLSFTAQHRPTGDLGRMDADDIAIAAQWNGDPEAFLSCLVTLGLLDETDEGYIVHDWQEHNPWAVGAPVRSEKARKAADARWKGDNCNSDAGNALSMPQALPQASSSNAPLLSSPLPTYPENTPLSPPDGGQESAEDGQNDRAETASPSEPESPAFEPAPRRASRNRSVVTLSPEQQKRFDSFFASYPNREKKQEAVKAWAKINPGPELLAVMAAGLKRWKESERWTKDGGRYVMLAATWLNQSCWNDEPTPSATAVPPSGNHTNHYPDRNGGSFTTAPKLQDLTGIGGDKPIRSFPARRPSSEVRQ